MAALSLRLICQAGSTVNLILKGCLDLQHTASSGVILISWHPYIFSMFQIQRGYPNGQIFQFRSLYLLGVKVKCQIYSGRFTDGDRVTHLTYYFIYPYTLLLPPYPPTASNYYINCYNYVINNTLLHLNYTLYF